MINSLKLFFLIVVIFFLTDRGIFYILKTLNKDIYTGQGVGKVNTFLKEKDSVDLLVFGSSRAAHHVNPKYAVGSSYNMGRDATEIAFTGALISTLKKKNQIILVHIDHDWLYSRSYEGKDVLPLRFNALINEDIEGFFKNHYRKELVLSKFANTYACNGSKVLSILKNSFSKGHDYSTNKGYEPIFPTEEQYEIFRKSLKINIRKMNVGIHKPLYVNSKFEDIVRDIYEKASTNNSMLIFFTSPSLNKVDDQVRKSTNAFFESKGLTYWDHLDYFNGIKVGYWKDHTHLSDEGATAYSRYLGEELRKLL